MIYHLIVRPILRLLVAVIGEERAERWVDQSFAPLWYVIIPAATIGVTAWAVLS